MSMTPRRLLGALCALTVASLPLAAGCGGGATVLATVDGGDASSTPDGHADRKGTKDVAAETGSKRDGHAEGGGKSDTGGGREPSTDAGAPDTGATDGTVTDGTVDGVSPDGSNADTGTSDANADTGGHADAKADGGEKDAAGDSAKDALVCGPAQIPCGTPPTCTSVQTDPNNCGGCGKACTATGEACVAGVCGCPAGDVPCGTACVDTMTSSSNCGGCGTACTATGESCVGGACSCPTGEVVCTGSCVSTQTSAENCGSCGHACANGQVCSAGACVTSCAAPTTLCGNGCVDEQTDPNNCGACAHACATGATCTAGACACPTGEVVCGGVCVNEKTDSHNCGGCGTTCTVMGETCVTGACACPTGESVCAGACVNEQTDSNDCGACGNVCAAASHCAAGACAQVCGDGVREGTEQCDDGNTVNLDGCDSECRFEQDHRITGLAIEHGTSAFCAHNALGGSINTFIALGTLNGDLTTAVQDASLNLLIAFLNPVADLTGTNDPTVTLGVLGGTLTDAYTGAANGTSDLDWWYTADVANLSANRVPLAQLPGKIVAHLLTAGPGSISLPINLGSGTANLQLNNTTIESTLGAADAPTESTTGNPPGHLASENLSPTITSFETGGGTPAAPTGELCGDVTALSLSQIAVPATLAKGGADACSQGYSATLPTNSLLDVFVDGCTDLIQIVAPTQPDQPGGYKLTLTGNHVTGCEMGTTAVPLATCLAEVSYSAYLDFSTDRVIIR